MSIEILNPNIVIIAKDFNPSIFNQLWLVRNNIIREDEKIEDFTFSQILSDFRTENYRFSVLPNRLQLIFNPEKGYKKEVVDNFLKTIIKELPHTPYTAVGLNLHTKIIADNINEYEIRLKKFMLSDLNPLTSFFNSTGCRFGLYLSKDFLMMRLRLEIKPIRTPDFKEHLSFNFNFSLTLDDNAPDKIEKIFSVLDSWESAKNECINIMENYISQWEQLI